MTACKAEEVIGLIQVMQTDNPSTPLKITFSGDWNHRQIAAVSREVLKQFRQHMLNTKRELDLERSKGDEEQDAEIS